MAKSREKQRANKKLYNALQKAEEQVSPFRPDGTSDYTTFSALTGKELMSKSRPSELKQRLPGSFNG